MKQRWMIVAVLALLISAGCAHRQGRISGTGWGPAPVTSGPPSASREPAQAAPPPPANPPSIHPPKDMPPPPPEDVPPPPPQAALPAAVPADRPSYGIAGSRPRSFKFAKPSTATQHSQLAAGQLSAASSFTDIDEALKALSPGNVAFNVPSPMHVNELYTVVLVLSASKSSIELQTELQGKLVANSKIEADSIQIGPDMVARLTGQNFTITAVNSERQAVSPTENTEWRWDVRPLAGGSQRLHLTLDVELQVRGERIPRSIRTFDRDVLVNVAWTKRVGKFVSGNWQWLWATIVVPAALWVWRRRKSGA
jgi:hypothetical protein